MNRTNVAKNLREVITEMKSERDQLDEKIEMLESTISLFSDGTVVRKKRGPGRPKGSKNKTTSRTRTTRKKPQWSEEKRREAAERMRKHWAEWRKKNAGKKKTTSKKTAGKKKKTSSKKKTARKTAAK